LKRRKTAINRIVELAEAEGLSYGKYVAKENAVHTERRTPAVETVKPRGISTIQAALRVDCPKLCASIVSSRCSEQPIEKPKQTIKELRGNAPHFRGLPPETILKIRALKAQGETYRSIAFICDISESSVRKYLKK